MKHGIALAALLLATGASDPDGSIEVTVSGVRSAAGQVVVDVCPEKQFLHSCPWEVKAPARTGSATLTVRGVPPGRYAVQAYHDANANGDLDQNWLGIPKEGLGFSNDAMPKLMRPKFGVAAFDHGAGPQHLAVTLRYFTR